jgi:hypothetical protein
MAFDLQSAQPATLKFDLASAAPVSEIPGPRRAWGDVAYEAVSNVPSSAGKFIGGLYEAVTSPVQTAKGLLDLGAGALQKAMPKPIADFINKFDQNPEAAQRAMAVANAVGGQYQKDYGSVEGLKNKIATDPVGFASDVSMLLSVGASAAAKVSPAAGKALSTAATFTNPAAPIAAAAEYGIKGGAAAAGNIVDALSGQRSQVRAGNIIRNALTEEGRTPQNVLAAQQAIQNAPAGATVRQALADVTAPQIQYLGELVEARTPGAKMTTQQAQEASRLQRMEQITPDLQAAQALRAAQSTPLYQAATQPTTAVSTAPLIAQIDSLLAANPGNTKLVTALNQVKTGLENSANAQQVSSVLDNLKDLIATKDNKFIVKNLIDIKKNVESALPGYQQAQQVFAAASPPVNQAQVLGAMRNVLEQPLAVGERAGPFMTAMGRGEQALLKKATGESRYAELADVLSPLQMKVVGEVKSELMRDAQIAAQARAGAEAMNLILEANTSKFRLPGFLDFKVTLANQVLRLMEGRLNKNVMAELERGFASGTDFVSLMNKIPASERIPVLQALGAARGQLSPTKLNLLERSQNALATESQPTNNLAPP